ncbi:metallophosphoesterase family protein [Secundilactobacillus folii]|uniref:Calcineurin-like phosphoesterase domain-containing protein n=1 Tax=Secundilactobacillus folii TaxID=2678357 RepID=A0A7X2XT29_9LACO|nr:metallophosphoesterase [Secundilactobacillus folii]MTV81128.1 hypothetical protein [Secundilactobacillus folii]
MKERQRNFTSNLIDGQKLTLAGWFIPSHFLVSRKAPNLISKRVRIYPKNKMISYQGKLKSDGHFWLIVENEYLNVADYRQKLAGNDLNPIWGTKTPAKNEKQTRNRPIPVIARTGQKYFVAAETLHFRQLPEWTAITKKHKLLYTGHSIVYSRIHTYRGIQYIQTDSGFLPLLNQITGHRFGILTDQRFKPPVLEQSKVPELFKMHGVYCFTKRLVKVYQLPDLNSTIVGRLDRGSIVNYSGKLVDPHRGWLQLMVTGRPYYVPFMTRFPNHENEYGYEITGSKSVTHLVQPWSFTKASHQHLLLNATAAEKKALSRLELKLNQVRTTDSIVVGLINDTHYDARQSSDSQRPLHDLLLMAHFAKTQRFDAVVMNGDLVDGNQILNRTIIDTADAVAALHESHVPTFITQGNHDDNSGFGRYLNGLRNEQVMTEATERKLHDLQWENLLDTENQFYGKYRVPGTDVTLIMLNTFDIRDASSKTYFDRNYHDRPNGIHWTGILQNIRHSRSRITTQQVNWLIKTLNQLAPDEQAIIFTHDSLRSATDRQAVTPFWTYDWFANNQQGDYARAYQTIVAHRQQIIAVMSAHTHVDDWSKQDGINWVTTTSDITNRRKSARLDSQSIGAWDVLVIQPSQRQLFRLRYGWQDRAGRLPNWQYRLFGDGTDTQHHVLAALLNQFKRQPPLTGNGFYYQNQNKQVNQQWRGFRGYFKF